VCWLRWHYHVKDIAGHRKSVAYVTNNKRLYSKFCTVEANYWQTRSTRGLFATAELLVISLLPRDTDWSRVCSVHRCLVRIAKFSRGCLAFNNATLTTLTTVTNSEHVSVFAVIYKARPDGLTCRIAGDLLPTSRLRLQTMLYYWIGADCVAALIDS